MAPVPHRCIATVRFGGTAAAARKMVYSRHPYDCHFRIDNKRIGAHRRPLSAQSAVLAAKFRSGWMHAADIIIDGVSFYGFTAFLAYFYSGHIKLTAANLPDILRLATEYRVPKLLDRCAVYLDDNIGSANVIEWLALATKYHIQVSMCEMLLATDALAAPAFLECDVATLAALLERMVFDCDEQDIFDACMRWAGHKCAAKGLDADDRANLRRELGRCFECIRFELMPNEAFVERYVKWRDLFTRDEAERYLLHFACNHRAEQMDNGGRAV